MAGPSPVLYAGLIAGIRQGDSNAVRNFRETFMPGIQFFMRRGSKESDVLGKGERVVMSMIEEIQKGHITSADLPSQILESVRRNMGVRKLNERSVKYDGQGQSVIDAAEVATHLLKAIPKREREALRRYYVGVEAENDICADLGVTEDQFHDYRRGFKTQFINALRTRRRGAS
jgi:hypothetical protein